MQAAVDGAPHLGLVTELLAADRELVNPWAGHPAALPQALGQEPGDVLAYPVAGRAPVRALDGL
jgi:hypothetical protein